MSGVSAQVNQRVQVLEYGGKGVKTPLPNVHISVCDAPVATSSETGDMTLRFRELHDGDKVDFRRAEKAGYEVFNLDALDHWTVSSKKPFQVVMCRSDWFRSLREQYMRVASASYERQYRQDLHELEVQRERQQLLEQDYLQRMDALEAKYQQLLGNIGNYVERFARIDLESLSAEQQKIVHLVQEGRFEEAIAAYEAGDFLSRYREQCQDIEQIDAARQQLQSALDEKAELRNDLYAAINRQILTYTLAGGMANHRKIKSLYHSTIEADTTNVQVLHDFLNYITYQGLEAEDDRYIQLFFRHTEDRKDLQLYMYVALSQALFIKNGLYKQSEVYYNKAVELARPYMGDENAPLGYRKACALLSYATIMRELSAKNSQAIVTQSTAALKEIASLYSELQSTDLLCHMASIRCMKAYSAAILERRFQEAFAQMDSVKADLSPLLGTTELIYATYSQLLSLYFCGTLAYLKDKSHETDSVAYSAVNQLRRKIAIESFDVARKAYRMNPGRFMEVYLCSCYNLGGAYSDFDQWDELKQMLDDSQDVQSALAASKQSKCLFFKVKFSIFYAQLYDNFGDMEKAKKYAQQAVRDFESMANYPDLPYVRSQAALGQDINRAKKILAQ